MMAESRLTRSGSRPTPDRTRVGPAVHADRMPVAAALTGGRTRRGRASAPRTGSRPLTRLTVVSLVGHLAFELAAGVGMPLASILGPYAAAGAWTLTTGGAWRLAARG